MLTSRLTMFPIMLGITSISLPGSAMVNTGSGEHTMSSTEPYMRQKKRVVKSSLSTRWQDESKVH